MLTIGRALRRVLDTLYLLGGVIAALFTVAILLIIVAQMVARWTGQVFPGATDYAGYCMAGASFFAFAYALNHGAHIRVSLFLQALGNNRRWGELWCFIIGTAASTYFAWYATKGAYWSWKLRDISQGLDATPVWIPQISMVAGTILLAIAFWDHLIRLLFTGSHGIITDTVSQSHAEQAAMEQLAPIAIFLFVLFLLLGSGVWVGLSLLGVAYVGMELFTNRPAGDAMITTIWTSSSSWTLTALPLFIWMGEILYRTRLSEDMFRGLAPWMARLPGGLVHTNIVGCTVFAAVSGSSAATLTTVGKMSIPELRKRGYPETMVIGTLAGAATLGLMIPPSLTLIVYGVTINESITKLFMAGVVPGLVLAIMFMTYVAVMSKVSKSFNPAPEPPMSFAEKLKNSRFLIPVICLILVVIGSMYLGYATATEAAAFGVIGSLILAASQGSLAWSSFTQSLMGAVRTSAMIALILAGAAFLSLSMGFTGLPRGLADLIASWNLSTFELLMALLVFYIVLGCFLDGISSVVLTMAVVEPMIRQAGIDIIWFGIFIVVVVEMAQITPPIGFNLFVLQGMTRHEMNFIARAAIPMFLIMVVMVFVLIAFPDLATWLPENIRKGPGGQVFVNTGVSMLGSPGLIALVFAIVYFASIVQVGLGMGFGLTAAPLLALINPDLVPAPTLVLGMLTAGWGAWREKYAVVWNEVATGAAGRIAGVAAGAVILASLTDPKTFMLVFGLMIGLAVLLSVGGWRLAFTRPNLLGVSTLSGLMGTITSVGAPPLALIYQHRPPASARPTLAAFFALGCLFSLTGLAAAGRFGTHDLALAGYMLPPLFAGIGTARFLRGRFDRRYRPALLAISGTAAVILILRGLA